MAVLTLAVIGICQIAFIRENALLSFAVVSSAKNRLYGIPEIDPAAVPSTFSLPSVPDNAPSEKDSPAWHPLLPQAGNKYVSPHSPLPPCSL